MRINKYLAQKKYTTRRGADELIVKGLVFINGRVAKLGEMVEEGDKVEVHYRAGKKRLVYFAYHKPRGIITHSASPDEEEIMDQVEISGVFPVGRLDKDSSGLIILTNDGRITERLLSPKYEHEKEYIVTTKDKLQSTFKDKMEAGVSIGDGEITRPCKVEIINEREFKIILTEGKNRQIRRMCAALGHEVMTLKRVRVMNILLFGLQSGKHREIIGDELKEFLASLEL